MSGKSLTSSRTDHGCEDQLVAVVDFMIIGFDVFDGQSHFALHRIDGIDGIRFCSLRGRAMAFWTGDGHGAQMSSR